MTDQSKRTVVCAGCNEQIYGNWIVAMKKDWHLNHFVCFECEEPLSENVFHIQDEKPYCKKDYVRLFCKRCHSCNEPISQTALVGMGLYFHPEHFLCSTCQKPIDYSSFYSRGDTAICKKCYESSMCPSCRACGLPITEAVFHALNNRYHQNCFRCAVCDAPISSMTFAVYKGQPVCGRCISQGPRTQSKISKASSRVSKLE